MKEIGGFFGLEQLISNEYYKNLIPLNTGRSALLYLLRGKNINRIYIPFYLHDSVSEMLKNNSYDFGFYNIDSNFFPLFNRFLKNDEYIFIVNYFGQLTNRIILKLKQQFHRIIVDNVQAFFQKPLDGIDTIYSCRKFFGVPDGSYLSTNISLDKKIKTDFSGNRMIHLLGRYEHSAYDFYNDFIKIEKLIDHRGLKYMSKLTHNILGAVDYNRISRIRNKNYHYLDKIFKQQNQLRLVTPDGPFAYPLYKENGIEIRKKLAEKRIYIPTLWPNVLRDCKKNTIEYQYAANILPLPCDQRYREEDLAIMCNELSSY